MPSSITLEPAIRTGIEAEVEYRLCVEDQVACWAYLAWRAPQVLLERVRRRLKDSLALLQGVFSILAMVGISLLASTIYLPAAGACAAAAFLLGLILMGILDGLMTSSPRFFLEGRPARLYRWAILRGLRRLARTDERAGTLDTASCYHLTLSRESFTRTAERQETRVGLVTVTTRIATEERVAWDALAFIGRTDQHVFLVIRDGTTVIVPHRCSVDEGAFPRFVEIARTWQAVARVAPPVTGITKRIENVSEPPLAG